MKSSRRPCLASVAAVLASVASVLVAVPASRASSPPLTATSLVQALQGRQLAEVDPAFQELLEDPGQGRPRLELTVLDAVETALRRNLDVRVARYGQELSRQAIMGARARFDPSLSFRVPQNFGRSSQVTTDQTQGAAVRTDENFNGGFTFSETLEWGASWSVAWNANRLVSNNEFQRINPRIFSSLGFSVTQPLLEGFGAVNRTGIVVARNDWSASQENFRGQVQTQIQQVYNAYWDLQLAIRGLEVDQESLRLALRQLERNRIQVEIGAVAPVETVQPRQQVSNVRLAVVRARNLVETRLDELKRLLNLESVRDDWSEVFIDPVDEPEETVGEIDVDRAVATALENDPGLRAGRIDLDSSRAQLDQSRNALLPQVDLRFDVGLTGTGGDEILRGAALGGAVIDVVEGGFGDAVGQLFSGDFRDWSVGLTVTMPLHDWAARSQHARQVILQQQQRASLRRDEQQVAFDVRQAVRDLENLEEQVEVAREAAELARLQLEAEELEFQLGESSNFEILDLQNRLNDARVQELQAIAQLARARVQLEVATGTVLEFFGVSVDEAGRAVGR